MAKVGTAREARVRLYLVGTDAAKHRVTARLQIRTKGPGFIHLPDWVTTEYLEQLTSERLVSQLDPKTRRVKRSWVKTRNRNVALDLEVGCPAGLFILQQIIFPRGLFRDLAKLAEAQPQVLESVPPPVQPTEAETKPRQVATPIRRAVPRRLGMGGVFGAGGWHRGGGSW